MVDIALVFNKPLQNCELTIEGGKYCAYQTYMTLLEVTGVANNLPNKSLKQHIHETSLNFDTIPSSDNDISNNLELIVSAIFSLIPQKSKILPMQTLLILTNNSQIVEIIESRKNKFKKSRNNSAAEIQIINECLLNFVMKAQKGTHISDDDKYNFIAAHNYYFKLQAIDISKPEHSTLATAICNQIESMVDEKKIMRFLKKAEQVEDIIPIIQDIDNIHFDAEKMQLNQFFYPKLFEDPVLCKVIDSELLFNSDIQSTTIS